VRREIEYALSLELNVNYSLYDNEGTDTEVSWRSRLGHNAHLYEVRDNGKIRQFEVVVNVIER